MSISPDRILFSDDHLLVVSKLAGELTVRGKGQVGKLPLYDFLHEDYPGLRVLHRLDFDTSGIVVFARSKAACDAVLASGFAGWKKVYRAIVAGVIGRERGVIRAPLPARSIKGKQAQSLVPAVTNFTVLKRFAGATYIECNIETGRHHQIRRHCKAIGHPLALDEVYGDAKFNRQFGRVTKFRKFFLHASALDLRHPISGEHLHIEAPLPRAFLQALERLGGPGKS
ncbi:RluA family pseudouridine synthase [Candidatus Peribacteria bacterium]|nr:RluA family pseudouridine synthase [Candidatus Peribacteria bacterium]